MKTGLGLFRVTYFPERAFGVRYYWMDDPMNVSRYTKQ